MKKIHLIGIGGVGMSALATLLKEQGHEVTGADRNLATPNVRFLVARGIACFPDDGSGVDEETGEVVVSTAIEESNPGLAKARRLGIKVTHRAARLAAALSEKKLVAVVGTCGKSTVTAMLGHVLSECGLDPVCVNGANVPGWTGAVRTGAGEYAVAEVDESDKSLVAFHPYAAIVTNASADHYSEAEMNEVFDAFVSNVPGPVIDGRCAASGAIEQVDTSMPGEHNRINAALALRMAVALGVDEARARAALQTFGGVERRYQRHGEGVYDDYAHNPEKLRAMIVALKAARAGRICVVWRPHGYAPLRKMLANLAAMFNSTLAKGDKLLLLPVYDAGGTTDRSINSDALLKELKIDAELVESHAAAVKWIKAHPKFVTYVTAGARDPELPALADAIASAVG